MSLCAARLVSELSKRKGISAHKGLNFRGLDNDVSEQFYSGKQMTTAKSFKHESHIHDRELAKLQSSATAFFHIGHSIWDSRKRTFTAFNDESTFRERPLPLTAPKASSTKGQKALRVRLASTKEK